jgi:hypothetical protein
MQEACSFFRMTAGCEKSTGIFETELDARELRGVEPIERLVGGHFEPR